MNKKADFPHHQEFKPDCSEAHMQLAFAKLISKMGLLM